MVIAGAGGGLGHIACQLASHGMALRVIGIDHGSKEQLAKDCGAEHFIDITKHDDKSIAEEVVKVAGGLGASAVIVCTARYVFSEYDFPFVVGPKNVRIETCLRSSLPQRLPEFGNTESEIVNTQ